MASASRTRTQHATGTLAHVDCVDRVVREEALIPQIADVSHSWRRCAAEYHLQPQNQAAPHIITESELRAAREPIHNLILHAQEEIDRLYAIVQPQDYVVLLCNSDGLAIHHRGDGSKAEGFKHWGIWLGGVWSEQVEGTNGIGTCITEQRPVSVHRGQHFRTRHTNLSCAGAPIFDPHGRLAAVLDTSSMNPRATDESLSLVLAATKVSARGIEARVFRECFQQSWNITAAPCGNTDRAVSLAVDDEQRILGADRVARRAFSLNDQALNGGLALSTIFEYDPSIFRCKRAQDIPARLIRTGTDQWWNALITPPVCSMSGWCSPTDMWNHCRPRIGMLANLATELIPAGSRGGLPPGRTHRICEYIESHLHENVALDALAEIAGLSVHHFARAFRQSVGIPPHGYLVQRRVERARHLLRKTDLPLSEIALAAGFSDQSHFARHFRRLTGTSPSVARRAQQ